MVKVSVIAPSDAVKAGMAKQIEGHRLALSRKSPLSVSCLVGFVASLTTSTVADRPSCPPTRVTVRQHSYSTLIYFLNIASAMLYNISLVCDKAVHHIIV
jgi:hypothetical protein